MYGNKSKKNHYRVGGTRGGQSQFKWDDVKVDKFRENYLGHSVNATIGRWQKGRDLTWYAKSKEQHDAELEEERAKIRALDEDLLNDALGVRNAKRKFTEHQGIDKDDMKALLSKGSVEREEAEPERVKGLGGAPMKFHEHIERKTNVEKELERLRNPTSSDRTEISGSITDRVIPLPAKDIRTESNGEEREVEAASRSRAHGHDSDRSSVDNSDSESEPRRKRHKKDKDEGRKERKHKHKRKHHKKEHKQLK